MKKHLFHHHLVPYAIIGDQIHPRLKAGVWLELYYFPIYTLMCKRYIPSRQIRQLQRRRISGFYADRSALCRVRIGRVCAGGTYAHDFRIGIAAVKVHLPEPVVTPAPERCFVGVDIRSDFVGISFCGYFCDFSEYPGVFAAFYAEMAGVQLGSGGPGKLHQVGRRGFGGEREEGDGECALFSRKIEGGKGGSADRKNIVLAPGVHRHIQSRRKRAPGRCIGCPKF